MLIESLLCFIDHRLLAQINKSRENSNRSNNMRCLSLWQSTNEHKRKNLSESLNIFNFHVLDMQVQQ